MNTFVHPRTRPGSEQALTGLKTYWHAFSCGIPS